MTPSPALIEFLRAWEGPPHFVPRQDRVNPNVFDIGYGHVCPSNHPEISPEDAEAMLVEDAAAFGAIVTRAVTAPLEQQQFDALTAFCLNVGPGVPGRRDGFVTLKSGAPSTMRRLLDAGDYAGAAAQFAAWNKAMTADGFLPVLGLTKRRAAEHAIFLSGDYSRRP